VRLRRAEHQIKSKQSLYRACQFAYWPYSNGLVEVVTRAEQLSISFPELKRRGGARMGAGRKKGAAHLRHTPHRARARHQRGNPVHVTLRAFSRSLRSQHVAHTVLGAIRDSNRELFRIAHYSVQENHLHLIVEAESTQALASGVRGLEIRIARRVNRLLFRRGRFWADRWHGRALASPSQLRNALVYVLQNRRKHSHAAHEPALDALSSAQWFDGFSQPIPSEFRSIGPPGVPPRTWLLAVGWKQRGLINGFEAPAPRGCRRAAR
jgi:REP element-mobilizing transposase RayT